jgi:hypothetical protein
MGGLGNYLFQLSFLYSYSKKYNKKMVINSEEMYSPHKSYEHYKDNIFRKINFESVNTDFNIVNENKFEFDYYDNIDGSVKFYGHFQSEKYFIDNRNEILKLFEIDFNTKEYILNKYQNYLSEKTCSVHVRRGDYLNHTDSHPILDLNYYKKSYESLGDEYTYFILSDDLEWCKNNFDFINKKIFITDNTDYQDLYLMSMCDNNIIANSTFSWWGAWLNQNINKVVIYPNVWFGKNLNHNTNDLIPTTWVIK